MVANEQRRRSSRGVPGQLAVVAGVASALFAATARVVFGHLSDEKADSRIVNVAGRQRMLAQRMAREALAFSTGDQPSLQRLRDALEEFERTLTALLDGDEYRGLPPSAAESRERLVDVRHQWNVMAEAIDALAASKHDAGFPDLVGSVVRQADRLTAASDDVVATFDTAFASRVGRLRAHMTLIGVTGALLLAGTYVGLLADARRRTARAEAEVERKEAALQGLAEERRDLVRRLLHVSDDERRRVAADIHDGPTQQLVGAAMLLEAATASGDPAAVAENVALVQTYLDSAINETRRIIADLRPPQLEDLGVAQAVEQSLAPVARDFDVDLIVDGSGMACRPDRRIELNLYRVAHEAAMNAIRHSGAREVRVVLREVHGKPSRVALVVSDAGCGFRPEDVQVTSGHRPLGLLGMRERVELLGGELSIESMPGQGTTVRALIPLEKSLG